MERRTRIAHMPPRGWIPAWRLAWEEPTVGRNAKVGESMGEGDNSGRLRSPCCPSSQHLASAGPVLYRERDVRLKRLDFPSGTPFR